MEQHDSLSCEHLVSAETRQQIALDYTRALEDVSVRRVALDFATADLESCLHQLALLCGVQQA